MFEKTASAIVDAAYAQRLVLFHDVMGQTLAKMAEAHAHIDLLESRLTALKDEPDGERKDAVGRLLSAGIEQASEKLHRLTGDYGRAKSSFVRILDDAVESAARPAPKQR